MNLFDEPAKKAVEQLKKDLDRFPRVSIAPDAAIIAVNPKTMIRVVIGSDHAGFALKEILKKALAEEFHVTDVGTDSEASVDYPDFAQRVAEAILAGRAERGILICGSGVGASVAANKIAGIRAGLCHDTYSAHQGVEHDQMNVLVLGSRVIGDALAKELAAAFLAARFSGEERHVRRLRKVLDLEAKSRSGAD